MAFSLGKVTLIIGAGLIGGALSKEGRLSDVTGILSGGFKIITKNLKQDKGITKSSGPPQNDSLLTQVNSLRQELQLLASSRSVTVVSAGGSGSGPSGTTVVIVFTAGVVGYVYIWWKGYKLSDLMFVTRRSFSDAVKLVGAKVDRVTSSVDTIKQDLSSKIKNVDDNVIECLEISAGTKDEVLVLQGNLSGIHQNVEYVQRVVSSLETKLERIEASQEFATQGVYRLCKFVKGLEQLGNGDQTSMLPSSSTPALELPQATPITRTGSLPPLAPSSPSLPLLEPASPSATQTQILRPRTALSDAAFQDIKCKSRVTRTSNPGSGSSTSGISASVVPIGDLSSRETRVTARFGVPGSPKGTPSVQEPTSTENPGWFKLPSILTRSRSTTT